jgi:hypothetical protein
MKLKKLAIQALLSASLLCAACQENDKYVGHSTVKMPEIDPSWQLELIPNRGQHSFRVFVYKDKKYDALFTRNLGWNGGDGVQTTLLPDGNTFWSFNDSFYGVVNSADRSRGSSSFPRNTLMVQTPGDEEENFVWLADFVQTSNPAAERYYHARTHIRHPLATLSAADIQKGEIDQDYLYWAGDATIYNGQMQMLWGAVDNTDQNNLMRRFGTCLATYSLEGKPGDANYLKLISRNDNFSNDPVGYGATMWEDEDGHTYLYTTYDYIPLVARTATHDLNSAWEYYVSDNYGNYTWSSAFPTTEELMRSTILTDGNLCSMPWIFKKGDSYYLTGQSIYFGRTMYIYRSDSPYGPFSEQKVLFVVPDTIDKIGDQNFNWLYMINQHPHLSRNGELVFSTNTDPFDFWDNFNAPGSADWYRPYFFRVYNWEDMYINETTTN